MANPPTRNLLSKDSPTPLQMDLGPAPLQMDFGLVPLQITKKGPLWGIP